MHGELRDPLVQKCDCSACAEAKRYIEFCDTAPEFAPQRPSCINTRREAAQLLRYLAYELVKDQADDATDPTD
jgi:hypothetical protein